MLTLPSSGRKRLADRAEAAIRRTLAGAAGAPAVNTLAEAVGATVSTALPAVADAWGPVLKPLGVQMNLLAAYSFGSPIVEFADGGGLAVSRLATWLMVVDDLTGPVADRRALFVVADFPGGDENPGALRKGQEWLPFRLLGEGYRPGLRDLRAEGARQDGGLVWLELGRRKRSWAASAGSPVPGPTALGALLASMLAGEGGRPAAPGGTDDWSATVEELLNRTGGATVAGLGADPNFRAATLSRGPHGSGFVVLERRAGASIEDDLARSTAAAGPAVEGPISLVHIILRTPGPFEHPPGRA